MITVKTKELQKKLSTLLKTMATKSLTEFLDCYAFIASNGLLKIYSSDLECAMCAMLKTEETEDFSALLNAKRLNELVKTINDETISFEKTKKGTNIIWGSGSSIFPDLGIENNATPNMEIPDNVEKTELTMNQSDLLSAVNNTHHAIEKNDLRPILANMHFNFNNGTLDVVGTDSRKLIIQNVLAEGTGNFNLPIKAASLLKSILEKEGSIDIVFTDNNALFSTNDYLLWSRLTVGKFPNYKGIIPTQIGNVLSVNKNQLLSALKRVNVCADSCSFLIKIVLDKNVTHISSKDLKLQVSASESLPTKYEGEQMTIGFNATLLIDVLSNIASEEIEIIFHSPIKAIVIQPAPEFREQERLAAMVMPSHL